MGGRGGGGEVGGWVGGQIEVRGGAGWEKRCGVWRIPCGTLAEGIVEEGSQREQERVALVEKAVQSQND